LKNLGDVNVKPIDGIFDVFGDQSVIAIPTVGHTPGHQFIFERVQLKKLPHNSPKTKKHLNPKGLSA